MSELPIIKRAMLHRNSIAFKNESSEQTYQHLLDRSEQLAAQLLENASDLNSATVAMFIPADSDFVCVQWAIWRAGGIMLPLCLSATQPEWEYSLSDSNTNIVITTQELKHEISDLCNKLNVRLLVIESHHAKKEIVLPAIKSTRPAMILYTSGTTNKPKGVLTTHANIEAQIESLVEAWKWKASDRIPLFLPLHHIHGIINVICCAMWSGALVEPFARFDINAITNRVRQDAYTVFMAVPTIYVKLIQMLESTEKDRRDPIITGFKNMRLMVSGSAALPATVHDTWFNLTGQKLLERYGMTEIGMALSNPYDGERRPGSVGKPLPGVNIRLKSDSGKFIEVENEPGEIQISGPGVFKEYWNRPQITSESFDEEIWFRTGDMAVIEHGYYRIMGRLSTDIIKSGGYKLSALEIESTLLQHPHISECAVVGIEDETWGEAVAVAVILREGTTLQLEEFREWCRARLSVYKIPKHLVTVAALPKNAMGKVVKKEVISLFKQSK